MNIYYTCLSLKMLIKQLLRTVKEMLYTKVALLTSFNAILVLLCFAERKYCALCKYCIDVFDFQSTKFSFIIRGQH